MKVKVIGVDANCEFGRAGYDYHVCEDEDGEVHRFDLMVDGGFPDNYNPKDLIGKTIDIGWTHPFVSIANNVTVVE